MIWMIRLPLMRRYGIAELWLTMQLARNHACRLDVHLRLTCPSRVRAHVRKGISALEERTTTLSFTYPVVRSFCSVRKRNRQFFCWWATQLRLAAKLFAWKSEVCPQMASQRLRLRNQTQREEIYPIGCSSSLVRTRLKFCGPTLT